MCRYLKTTLFTAAQIDVTRLFFFIDYWFWSGRLVASADVPPPPPRYTQPFISMTTGGREQDVVMVMVVGGEMIIRDKLGLCFLLVTWFYIILPHRLKWNLDHHCLMALSCPNTKQIECLYVFNVMTENSHQNIEKLRHSQINNRLFIVRQPHMVCLIWCFFSRCCLNLTCCFKHTEEGSRYRLFSSS